ncbi:MAG: AraC family transcriptional regulator [Cyanobacteria bacterium P01_G01_bin.54]
MAIHLTAENVHQLWNETNTETLAWQTCYKADLTGEIVQTCPERLGWGQKIWTSLNRGWLLLVHDYQLRDDLVVTMEPGDRGTTLEFGFQLSGESMYSQGIARRRAGDNFLVLATPYSGGGTITRSHRQRIQQVDIHLNTFDEVLAIFEHQRDRCPSQVYDLLLAIAEPKPDPTVLIPLIEWSYQAASEHNWGISKTSLAMQTALQQLLNCPYQGEMRQLYLESKCLELFTLFFNQFIELIQTDNKRHSPHPKLQFDDIDRIHQARNILCDRFNNPPSLLDLAHQVGLNDYKLKIGFRYVFGTTTFGYLHQHRMEQASQLLQERHLSVGEVAKAVGYASRSSFVKAFRKRFGVSPSSYA